MIYYMIQNVRFKIKSASRNSYNQIMVRGKCLYTIGTVEVIVPISDLRADGGITEIMDKILEINPNIFEKE